VVFWFITIVWYLLAAFAAFFLSIVISFVTILPFMAADETPVVGGLFWLFAFLAEVSLLVPLSLAITAELVEREVQARHFSWPKARKRFLVAIPIAIGPLYAALFVVMRVEESRPTHWFEIVVLLNCASAVFAYLALRISQPSDSNHSAHAIRALREQLIEFVKLGMGFSVAGFSIAALQSYVAFSVRGNGFGFEAIGSACFLAGKFGVILGILTGMVAYYVILQRHVTAKQVAMITVGSLIVGCLGGIIFDWYFVFATPLLSIFIAWGVKA
jgi:hypothetical protein